MSGAVMSSVSSEFYIFAPKPNQRSVLGTVEIVYKHIAPVDQNDLTFYTARLTYPHRYRYKTLRSRNLGLELAEGC